MNKFPQNVHQQPMFMNEQTRRDQGRINRAYRILTYVQAKKCLNRHFFSTVPFFCTSKGTVLFKIKWKYANTINKFIFSKSSKKKPAITTLALTWDSTKTLNAINPEIRNHNQVKNKNSSILVSAHVDFI